MRTKNKKIFNNNINKYYLFYHFLQKKSQNSITQSPLIILIEVIIKYY